MSITIQGIASFPTLFTPKAPKGSDKPRYDVTILLAPTNPDLPKVQAAFEEAKREGFPSGLPGNCDVCFQTYNEKFQGRDYYDPRFAGWYVLTATAKAESRPPVVDQNYNPVIDPGAVYSGMVCKFNLAIVSYTAGKGGVGGFLNGVMITDEAPPMGRLDNKPTVEQMFGDAGPAPTHQAAPTPPAPPVPPAPVAPAPPAARVMTEKAGGVTYDQFIATGQWTDELLVQHGYMILPSFV